MIPLPGDPQGLARFTGLKRWLANTLPLARRYVVTVRGAV
ncbi:hypothetical protein QBC99_003553 [Beijerinckia sp. GAS462]|nr:hypothetical protein [Beijerinckia sp. GAS462]SEC87736.1 hypothetical protein SAMN05443249_3785 [Beijerinckia sp. 28-YEA-48]